MPVVRKDMSASTLRRTAGVRNYRIFRDGSANWHIPPFLPLPIVSECKIAVPRLETVW